LWPGAGFEVFSRRYEASNPCVVALENPEMTRKHTMLKSKTHFRLPNLLIENPEMSQRELAEAVGVSVGGMY
jgi:hypothetical protein